eukprot:1161453-Pelagomonas_calceolata.AAC.1
MPWYASQRRGAAGFIVQRERRRSTAGLNEGARWVCSNGSMLGTFCEAHVPLTNCKESAMLCTACNFQTDQTHEQQCICASHLESCQDSK